MSSDLAQPPPLRRALGLTDAVVVGLGAMLGAGVFVAFAPAAQAAGTGLLLALGIAAAVATCNALSTAQLAIAHPVAGGVYVYGARELGPWWGFLAGWGFVVGKTASCAAVALAFAAYVAPEPLQRPVAAVAVLGTSAVAMVGIERTARAAAALMAVALVAIAALVVAALLGGTDGAAEAGADGLLDGGLRGILEASGLLFFAFAGYARITTLGEEVRDPERTIPRAIKLALAATMGIYAVVGLTLLATLGPDRLARSAAPLEAAALRLELPWLAVVVVLAGAAATLGALLALLLGVSRTTVAMARDGELPTALAAIEPHHAVPRRAQAVVAVAVAVLVIGLDVRGAIGFSSAAVLLYYFVANVAALRQRPRHRVIHPAGSALGAVGCVVLALFLPATSLLGALLMLAVGVAIRAVRRHRRSTVR